MSPRSRPTLPWPWGVRAMGGLLSGWSCTGRIVELLYCSIASLHMSMMENWWMVVEDAEG